MIARRRRRVLACYDMCARHWGIEQKLPCSFTFYYLPFDILMLQYIILIEPGSNDGDSVILLWQWANYMRSSGWANASIEWASIAKTTTPSYSWRWIFLRSYEHSRAEFPPITTFYSLSWPTINSCPQCATLLESIGERTFFNLINRDRYAAHSSIEQSAELILSILYETVELMWPIKTTRAFRGYLQLTRKRSKWVVE